MATSSQILNVHNATKGKSRAQQKVGRRTKVRFIERTLREMTVAQRRKHSRELERKAHRRFDVALGRRVNGALSTVSKEPQSDIEAMFLSPHKYFKKEDT